MMQAPYRIGPENEWIQSRKIDPEQLATNELPLIYDLVDYQTHISENGIEHYLHSVVSIADASKISSSSQYLFDLRPGSEQVVLHACHIYRDGKTINALDPENIRAMQRETSLEQQVVNNQITVEVTIDDLRTGDTIEFKRTIIDTVGEHPVHGRFYRETHWLTWQAPVREQRIRIVNDTAHAIVTQKIKSGCEENIKDRLLPGESFDQTWMDIQSQVFTSELPNWYWPDCMIFTTENTWGEVSQYMHRYYIDQRGADAPLDVSEIEGIDWSGTPADTITRVIRFVQDEIRYRGESHGIYSHTPRDPQTTLRKRAGDCKDKSYLLVALLRHIGIKANPALVNTRLTDAIAMLQPSPTLFDHMIVHFEYQGQSRFVDATLQKQGGDINNRARLPFKKTLLLNAEENALQDIPFDQSIDVYKITHELDVTDVQNKLPELKISRRLLSERADNMRYYFQANERRLVEENFLEWAADNIGLKLRTTMPVQITLDDLQNNIFTTEERYEIITPVSEIPENLISILTDFHRDVAVPEDNEFPITLALDGSHEHEIIVRYEHLPEIEEEDFKLENQWFEYSDSIHIDENTVRFNMRIQPRSLDVKLDDMSSCHADAETLRNRSVSRFSVVTNHRKKSDHLLYLAPLGLGAGFAFLRSRGFEINALLPLAMLGVVVYLVLDGDISRVFKKRSSSA